VLIIHRVRKKKILKNPFTFLSKFTTSPQLFYVSQILIDVVGYSNHPTYKLFYAVFYVKPGICSEKRFNIIWEGYKFPNNWKPIFIIGE
jgi:hypothetical protein